MAGADEYKQDCGADSQGSSEDATIRARSGSLPCMLPEAQHWSDAADLPQRYRELREFARGGMGRILLVHDTHLGRDVALKELLSASEPSTSALVRRERVGWEDGGSTAARFIQEACLTGQLEHPSIVPVYEMGRRLDGVPYYTMRFVRGRTLKDAIEGATCFRERLALLPHFLDACQAIAYAHSRGVIHRDIKPSNILVGKFGETAVIDWGIAKLTSGECADEQSADGPHLHASSCEGLTRTGENLGTPPYMSPEQARGEANSIAEPADIYALGAVLYELLTGRPAYAGRTPEEVIARMLTGNPDPVRSVEPKVPAELAAICARAMQKDPLLRYGCAADIAKDLQRFQTGAMVQAYEYTLTDRVRRFVWQYRVMFGAALIVCGMIALAGAVSVAGILQEKARTEYALYISSISLAKAFSDSNRFADAQQALHDAPLQHRHVEWGLLEHRAHPELLVLRGHKENVDYAVFSPDGARIATCGREGRINCWDAGTGALQATIQAASEPVHRIEWSPDGQYLASSTIGEETVIWNAAELSRLHTLAGYDPVFSRDSRLVANITHFGRHVTLWDVASGEVVESLNREGHYLTRVDLSPDARYVAASDVVGFIWIWDRARGACWQSEDLHSPSARFVRFSPDGQTLASTGKDLCIRLWDVTSRRVMHELTGHEDGVASVAFTPDGGRLISTAGDRTVRVWNVATGAQEQLIEGLASTEYASLNPEGTQFVACGENNTAVVWPLPAQAEQETLRFHAAPVNSIAFSRDGRFLASGGGRLGFLDDSRLAIWDVDRGKIDRVIESNDSYNYVLLFWPDDQHLAAGGPSKRVTIYDIESGQAAQELNGHEGGVECLAANWDRSLLATGSWDGRVILWNKAGQAVQRLEGHAAEVDAVAFSPDGQWLATGARDKSARLWEVATGATLHEIPADAQEGIKAVAFGPTGELLATGGCDGFIRLWDVGTAAMVAEFRGHESIVQALAFTNDGRRIVSGSKDNSVRLWDVSTGKQLLLLNTHTSRIRTLAFHPSNSMLATGSDDNSVILWPIAPWDRPE